MTTDRWPKGDPLFHPWNASGRLVTVSVSRGVTDFGGGRSDEWAEFGRVPWVGEVERIDVGPAGEHAPPLHPFLRRGWGEKR